MGGVYITLCLLRTYIPVLKTGIIELLVEVAHETVGTIRSALRGGDVKQGIRYYKILYEAFS